MESEKDLEALKHVCKLCNKRYPNGKSLGGHMRSHVIANSKKNKLKVPIFDHHHRDHHDDHDDGQLSGYGLRENPKKSWRIDSDLKKVAQNQQICKQCGKGFQSVKALCGHMSSHSDKNRNFIRVHNISDDESWASDQNHSDDDDDHDDEDDDDDDENPDSEIDHLEQEDVAICLMMLSRDSSCSNYKTESSDNNSVILEGGSSSNGNKKNLNLSKIYENGNVDQEMDNSDSGYFENGAKELESDDSNGGFLRNCYNNNNYGYSQNSTTTKVVVVDSKKRVRVSGVGDSGFDSPEFDSSSKKKVNKLSSTNNTKAHQSSKTGKVMGHKCPYCPRVFKSGQALGGHKRSHMMGGGLLVRRPRSPSPPPEPEQKQPMIDLNLPAPLESSQFVGSW